MVLALRQDPQVSAVQVAILMHTRFRELTDIKMAAGEPTPEDLSLLRGDDFGGAGLAEEEVRVRAMLLAHDQYDRTYERFPRSFKLEFSVIV